jgi:hypothetical protein
MLNLIILKTGDPMKLSVFTVCMPEFTPEECVEYIASIGGDAVEWRCNYDEGDKSHPGYWSGNRTTISPEEMIKKGEYFKKSVPMLEFLCPQWEPTPVPMIWKR